MHLRFCFAAVALTFSSFAHGQLAIKDITIGLPLEKFKALFPAAKCRAADAPWMMSCTVKRTTVAERPREDDPNFPHGYHTVANQVVESYVGIFEDGKLARFNVWFENSSLLDKPAEVKPLFDAVRQKYGKPTMVARGKQQWSRGTVTLTVIDGYEYQSVQNYMGLEADGFEARSDRRLKRDELKARANAAPKNAKDL